MTRILVAVLLLGVSVMARSVAVPSNDAQQVALWVTVTDKKGALVGGLPQDVFAIHEDGEPQTITSFKEGKEPVSIGILLDSSASMGRKLARRTRGGHALRGDSDLTADVHRVLSNFLDYFPEPENEFFLIVFGREVETVTNFARDRDTILKAVASPSLAGRTALFDALKLAYKKMEGATNARKVFLLVSDGDDNESTSERSEVVEWVRGSQAAIYSVGIFGLVEPRRSGRTPELEGDAWLSKIARQSGGRHFPVVTREGFLAATDQIGKGLTEQYCLRYIPPPSDQQNRRKVEVKVNLGAYRKQVRGLGAKLPLNVHTRTGYDYTPSFPRNNSP